MKPILKLLSFSLIAFLISSCGKKMVYFQEKESTKNKYNNIVLSKPENVNEHIIKAGDIIGLKINSASKELNNEFLKFSTTDESKDNPVAGILVNENGTIFLPYIGSLKITDLTIKDAGDLIKKELEKSFNNLSVELTLNSFRITVLGEVKVPGIKNSPGDRMTIIDALSLSGDLGADANRKNIKVIRQTGDIKVTYFLDISSIDIFRSEVYYLKSNDIIYVETLNRRYVRDNITYVSLLLTLVNTLAILIRL